jgi:hypothetical protein
VRHKTCETCRFWESREDTPTDGYCHRYPRVISFERDATSYFPVAEAYDWCGEWAVKEADADV